MPPLYTPPHNLDALLIGTGEFSFALGATTLAQAASLGYRDFGNVKAVQIDSGGDDKEHYGSYRGTTRRDDMRKQKIKLGYKLTCDEWTLNSLRYMFFGGEASSYTRDAISAVPGTPIPFSANQPSQRSLFYDVLDAAGKRVRELTAVTFTDKTENVDFEVDYKMGRVRFLKPQHGNQTPTITADEIKPGSPGNLNTFAPLADNLFNGIGRLVIFDENDTQQIVFEHTDFSCQVEINGTPDVKGDDFSDLALMVSVTGIVGTVFCRED